MVKQFLSVLSVSFLLLMGSCSTQKQIQIIMPEPTRKAPVVYTTNISHINLPIEISLGDIERKLNSVFTDLIYEDTVITDDNIMMKIWKTQDIRLKEKDGLIYSEIPLRIWTKFRYGPRFLGLQDERILNLRGTMKFRSKVKLENWKMVTESEIIDFNWVESPTIEVRGVKIPVTYIVNPAINIFKGSIAKRIDANIEESSDFTPYVMEVLDALSEPMLTSDIYEVWLRINPMELNVANASIDNSAIKLNLVLKCTILTMIGNKPAKRFDPNSLQMKQAKAKSDKFNATIAAITDYESAGRILTRNFKDMVFTAKKRKFSVNEVSLWYRNERVIIALDVAGSIKGKIFLSGYPHYDPDSGMMYFRDLSYTLDTRNILLKTANWMAGDYILDQLDKMCRFNISKNIDEAKGSMLQFLDNYSPVEGVLINGEIEDFKFERMDISESAMIALIRINGQVLIKVDGLQH